MGNGDGTAEVKVPVESLRKGLHLLELMCGSARVWSLAGLADTMGWKRTTTHNLLKTLALCGYAENLGNGRYGPGWRVRDLGRMLWCQDNEEALTIVQTVVADVAADTGEAVVLAILASGCRQVVARADSSQAVRVHTDAMDADDESIWSVATGRVLAAHCSPAELTVIRQREGDPVGCWREARTGGLDAALQHIRDMRVARNQENDVVSMAIPVLADNNVLVGALGVHLPLFRYDEGRDEALLAGLHRGASRLAPVLRQCFAGRVSGRGMAQDLQLYEKSSKSGIG